MNAFISYSHQDSQMLDVLHKHLAQLQRDRTISAWTDQLIAAGGDLNQNIFAALETTSLFIALLSPDYIASHYCYEKEFEKALELAEQGKLVIIPIILEPCDWLNTPFRTFKALPKDGKAVSTWENKNTAFLDIIQNIRKLIEGKNDESTQPPKTASEPVITSRNYRVKKDFDSIEKIEFLEKTFNEVKLQLKKYIDEIHQLDNIKTRTLFDTDTNFECILVNRNKIDTESNLKISISAADTLSQSYNSAQKQLSYSLNTGNRPSSKSFSLSFDDYHLFWSESNYLFQSTKNNTEMNAKEIAETIFNEWLQSVGIM